MTTANAVEKPSFSQELRERTWQRHQLAEGTDFVASLMDGRVDRSGYAAMAAQHGHIYAALESVAESMQGDPLAGRFVADELVRGPHLEADLRFLVGDDWRDQLPPLAATKRYVARLHEMAGWPGGFVAHHYTRYLGDLSGGLAIGARVARAYGLAPGGDGVRFYTFTEIPKPRAFKEDYRAQLDAVAWADGERERVIDEVLLAYELNTAVFADLARHVGLES